MLHLVLGLMGKYYFSVRNQSFIRVAESAPGFQKLPHEKG